MSARKTIPFEGVLNCWNDPYDVPDLLLAVSRSGKTGRLLFSNAEGDKTLVIKQGRIIFAESSSDDDGLGQYLLRTGKISLQDFIRVSRLVAPGKRFGALLVAEGVLSPRELVPVVVGQVRSIILGLFRRTETWYGFKEEDLSRKESITLEMSVARLVLDGVQCVESWRRISKGIGDLDSVYRLVDGAEEERSGLELEEGVNELLSMLTEPTSVSDICTRTHTRRRDLDVCRDLWAFRALGWIDCVEAPALASESESEPAEPMESARPEVAEVAAIGTIYDPESITDVDEIAALAEAAAPPDLEPFEMPELAVASSTPAPATTPGPATNPSATLLDISLPPSIAPPAPAPAAPSRAAKAPEKPPIPQHLVQTRIAATGKAPAAAGPARPRPVPEDLARTRMAIDAPATPASASAAAPVPAPAPSPASPSQSQVTTIPSVPARAPKPKPKPKPNPASSATANAGAGAGASTNAKPKAISEDLLHTRMFVEPAELEESIMATPSTSEMMEAILDEGGGPVHHDRDSRNPGGAPTAQKPEPSVRPDRQSPSTQFFPGANALEAPGAASGAPKPGSSAAAEDASYDDFFPADLGPSFESLGLDYEAAPPSPSVDDSGAASFQELSLSETELSYPAEPGPSPTTHVDPLVVEAVEPVEAIPVLEGDIVTAEPEPFPPVSGGGMEIFAMTDPFGNSTPPAEPPPVLATDDPLEPTVAGSLPRRRRPEELDVDSDGFGHVIGDDRR